MPDLDLGTISVKLQMKSEQFEKTADNAAKKMQTLGNSLAVEKIDARINKVNQDIDKHQKKILELGTTIDEISEGYYELEAGMGRSGERVLEQIPGIEKLLKELDAEQDKVHALHKDLELLNKQRDASIKRTSNQAAHKEEIEGYRKTRYGVYELTNSIRRLNYAFGDSYGFIGDAAAQLTMFREELYLAKQAGTGAVALSAVGLGVGLVTTLISTVIQSQEELKKAKKEAFDTAVESISGYEQENATIQRNFEIIRNGTADVETLTAAKQELAESLDGVTVGFDKEGNAILASNDVIKERIELLDAYKKSQEELAAQLYEDQRKELVENALKDYAKAFADQGNYLEQFFAGVSKEAITTLEAIENLPEATKDAVVLMQAQESGLIDGFKAAVKVQLDGYNDLSDGAKLAVDEILAENQSLILSEDGVAQAIAIINATLADKQAMMEHQNISQHIADWNQKVALSAHNANEAIKESNRARIEEEMANAKNLLNILYAEINAYDTLANIQLYYKLLKDASDLSKTISKLRASLNSLGTYTPPAISSVSKAARDATAEINNLGKAVTSALKERYAEQQKAEEARIESSIKSWDKWESDTVSAIQAQMDALDSLEKQQESADKRAEYERKKQALELQKAYEKDAYQREQIQKEINRLDEAERERVNKEAVEAIRAELNAQIDAAQSRADAERDALEQQKSAIKDAYAERTTANALAAEAEKLILKSSQTEIIKLIESYSNDYQSAGKTLGERLAAGFSGGASAILSFVDKVQSGVNSVQSRVASGVTSSINAFYAARPVVTSAPVNVTVNFNTPVDSPVEVRREIEKVMNQVASEIARG